MQKARLYNCIYLDLGSCILEFWISGDFPANWRGKDMPYPDIYRDDKRKPRSGDRG
jgi:hypothetical protein